MEKNIGQVHLVYHIHLNGGKFRQSVRQETGIGLGSVVNHTSCARHALRPMGSGRMTNRKMNDRKKIAIVPTGHNAI